MRIFVINPGSTSTKLAIYEDDKQIWEAGAHHPVHELEQFHHAVEQFKYRLDFVYNKLDMCGIPLKFDAIIARGGLLRPTPGGVYQINDKIKHDLIHAEMDHACNLGALIPEARLTGIPEINRVSIFHALNSKALSRKYAEIIGKRYEDINLIVAHMGGGISVGAHRRGKVIDVNNALNGEGPFSPERAGTIPADQLAELCFSGKYTLKAIKKLLNGKGGLTAHLGTNDVATIAEKAQRGEEPYNTILKSMIYNVAKQIGAMYVALKGDVDCIILTGGIAYCNYCIANLKEQIDYLAKVEVMPGENEMDSLAYNALSVLKGKTILQEYNP